MKTKIQIKSIWGTVLFEFEKEDNTLKDTVVEANLRGANLYEANLRGADLRGADLRGAKNIDKLQGLEVFKHDMWAILLFAQAEVTGLKKALVEGKIDGSVYNGECACLCGTIANIRKCDYKKLDHINPDSSRPAERWFMGIKPGDAPAKNDMAKLAVAWIEEFELALAKSKPAKRGKAA